MFLFMTCVAAKQQHFYPHKAIPVLAIIHCINVFFSLMIFVLDVMLILVRILNRSIALSSIYFARVTQTVCVFMSIYSYFDKPNVRIDPNCEYIFVTSNNAIEINLLASEFCYKNIVILVCSQKVANNVSKYQSAHKCARAK